jgi:hypothetical protein
MRSCLLAIIAITALPWASPAADPTATAKLVAPYIDADTFAVVHVNLGAIDVDAAAERFAKAAGVDMQEFAGARKHVGEALASFRKAGANELFAVVSMADLPFPGPFVLVPRAGTNDAEVTRALGLLGSEVVEPIDGVLFAGSKAARARLKTLKPSVRPDLAAAFTALAGDAFQVALVPGDDQRKIASELLPPLPAKLGGGSAVDLVRGVRWAAFGVTMKPKLAARLVVHNSDAAGAKRLADIANRGLDWFGEDNATKEVLPKFAALRPGLSPKVDGERVTFLLDESSPGVAAALTAMSDRARSAASRTQSMNNLKQIGLAWHLHLDANAGTFPAPILSKDGKPLLSWRVAILPFIEQGDLYKQFHLDEPWDSEHNKTLIEKMPKIYRSSAQKVGDGQTTYLAPTGKIGEAHVGVLGARIKDVTDGTSNTVMVVEGSDDAAVVWTKPDDLTVDAKNPLKGLIGHYPQGFNALYADGSVRFISRNAKPAALLAIFTRDGGEVANDNDLQ